MIAIAYIIKSLYQIVKIANDSIQAHENQTVIADRYLEFIHIEEQKKVSNHIVSFCQSVDEELIRREPLSIKRE